MLTMKSKIKVYWTTDPAELGYGTPTGAWKKGTGEIMSMKEALEFSTKLYQKIGKACCAISYQCNGKEITRTEIAVVIDNDMKFKKS